MKSPFQRPAPGIESNEMIEVADKFLALIFSLLILGQGYLLRQIVGTWLVPGCIFSIFWFGYTFFPLLLVFNVPVNPWSVAFIFLCTLAFSASSLGFNWKFAIERNRQKTPPTSSPYDNVFLGGSFYVATVCSLVFLVANTLMQDITAYDLIFNFFESSAQYAGMRYAEEIRTNIFGQLGIVLTYVGATLGGFRYVYAKAGWSRGLVLVLSFLPSIFVMSAQSAKGMLFLAIILFYGAILVCRIFNGDLTLLNKRGVKMISVYSALVIPIVAVSFLSRGLYESEDTDFVINRLIYYFASYAFSHIYAFSDWFTYAIGGQATFSYVHEEISHGFYTFMALFKLAGSDKETPLGVYDEYYAYADLLQSNIYTIYRGLIQDFGFIGTLLFMFGSGSLLHLAFNALLVNRRPVLTVAIFIFMLGYFFSSFLISFLMWNSIYVSFVLLFLVLCLNSFIASTRRRRPGWPSARALSR